MLYIMHLRVYARMRVRVCVDVRACVCTGVCVKYVCGSIRTQARTHACMFAKGSVTC